jgi:hypothetical protein
LNGFLPANWVLITLFIILLPELREAICHQGIGLT